MHTGYENFWMYQNSRPEPLLSLPNSQNFNCAVNTDSHKQVLNGEVPIHLNNYKPPQNNISSSQNDYCRITGSQSSWQSSRYPYPSWPSHANNAQFQSFSSQSNNVRHLSSKNLVSKNFDQMYNRNNPSNYSLNQNKKTSSGETSRIRVKNVFSMSNNSVIESSFVHQKEAHQSGLNHRVNHNRLWNCDTQAEYVDYGKINSSASNQHLLSFESKAPEQSCLRNQQQYIPSLEEVCNQSLSFLSGNQLNFFEKNELERNSLIHTSSSNTINFLKGLLCAKNLLEGNTHNGHKLASDTLTRSKRVKINPKRKFCELNMLGKSRPFIRTDNSKNTSHLGFQAQKERLTQNKSVVNNATEKPNCSEKTFCNVNQSGNSLNQSSVCPELREVRYPTSNNAHLDEINKDNSIIKITIPHTGQSTYVSFNQSENTGRDHNLSLTNLTNLMDSISCSNQKKNSGQENEEITLSALLTGQSNSENQKFHEANSVCTTSLNRTEIVSDSNVSQQNFSTFLKNLPSNQSAHEKQAVVNNSLDNSNDSLSTLNSTSDNCRENLNPVPINTSTETVFFKETISVKEIQNIPKVKQEDLSVRVETTGEQLNENILQNEVLPINIKSEKPCEENIEFYEQKVELQLTENSNPLEESLPIDADNTENIDFTQSNHLEERVSPVKKSGIKTRTMSTALKDAENRIQKPDMDTIDINEEEKTLTVENKTKAADKDFDSEISYKSQINRAKLDLLIQFLKKDEETVKFNASKVKIRSVKKINVSKTNSSHNRRKLSKTCIVKNKNNSREMISLVSHKTYRMDTKKCSPKTSGTVEPDKDCSQIEATKTLTNKTDRNVEHLKVHEPFEQEQSCLDEADKNTEKVILTEPSALDLGGEKNFLAPEAQISVSREPEHEVTEESSADKYIDQEDEEDLVSVMKALQKLKTHFCMNCNLVSSIDSFWINVVSGELRCLNCFKKIILKVEERKFSNRDIDCVVFSLESKSKEKNCKSDSENRNGLRSASKSNCDDCKTNEVNGNVKDVTETEAQSGAIKETISKSYNGESGTVSCNEITLQTEKSLEEEKMSEVEESSKSSKSKESVTLKTRVPEDGLKLKAVDSCDSLKKKRSLDVYEFTDNVQTSENKNSPIKFRKSISIENCSGVKSPASDHSELFSDSSVTKNVTKKNHVSSKIKRSKGIDIPDDLKSGETDKLKKSLKKRDISDTAINKVKTQEVTAQNRSVQRINSKDFSFHRTREENRKKDIKEVVNTFVKKSDLSENCPSDKSRANEEISKKSTKHDCLDKTKSDNFSRDGCADQKLKTFELKKRLEVGLPEKSSSIHNGVEMNSKLEFLEISRKRKNSDDCHSVHKVRVIEEHAKKTIKQIAPSEKFKTSVLSEDNASQKNKMDNDKSNFQGSVEKSKKHRLFRETCEDFEFSPERPRTRSPLKADKTQEKMKCSHHFKYKPNESTDMVRRNSQEECKSPKNNVSKESSRNEIKKDVESPTHFKKNSSLREELSFSKVFEPFKNESIHSCNSLNNQNKKKTTVKRITGVLGKIPKITHPSQEADLHDVMRSPLDNSQCNQVSKHVKETENAKIKSGFRKDKPISPELGEKTHKGRHKNNEADIKGLKKDNQNKEKINHLEAVKNNFENNHKLTRGLLDKSKQSNSFDDQNRKHKEYCIFGDQKKDTSLKPCLQCALENEKAQSSELLSKLLRKTKKLSRSLLGETKGI